MFPISTADPLLILAVVLVAGMGMGWVATQFRLPNVTGQIIAGIVIGPSALAIFEVHAIEELQPLTHFALALIGVTVGAHLNLRRLRNAGRRLFLLMLTEAAITPFVVWFALSVVAELDPVMAILLATLAVSTAPATVVALVRERRARGVFVKTLIAAVAINNVTCIVLFELARNVGRQTLILADGGEALPLTDALVEPIVRLGMAIVLGGGAAAIVQTLTIRVVKRDVLTSVSAISILLTFGVANQLGLSPLLACLALGAVQTNLNPSRDRLADSVFANFEPVVLCVFFTLAGLHLHFDQVGRVGMVAAGFFAARIVGKLLSARVAMALAGATSRVRQNLGPALVPQAGVAVGLVILIQEDAVFGGMQDAFAAVVLLAVTANEIVGPVLTRAALGRAGEVGRDHPRLVDFLQEENITTRFRAESAEEAIERLVDLLISSHDLRTVDREVLLASVLAREAEVSTCIGGGLAVPHGELPEGSPMLGVMALSSDGLPFDTPDDLPVHCVVLLATPAGERDRHLEVLGTLARTIGTDPTVQQRLYNAKTPAHAYEILHGEETEDFNYFLEEESAT